MANDVDCPECGETLALPKKFDRSKKVRCSDCDCKFLPFDDADENERPQKSSRKKKSKAAALPKWLPFAIGGGAFAFLGVAALVVFLAFFNSAPSKPSPELVKANPTTPRSKPESTKPEPTKPTTRPDPEPEPEPEPVPIPEPKPRIPDPKPPRELPVRMELPPLPPPGERPVLVLDPGAHTSAIKAVDFFPDGKRFATFSEDKTIRIWDLETGLTLRTIAMPNGPGIEGALMAGAISPDGKLIAAGGLPFGAGKLGIPVYLISTETGEVVRTGLGHKNIVLALHFSADGKQLVSSGPDGTAIVYTVATGKVAAQLTGHKASVRQVKFHSKDNRIATASNDGTARIWTPGTPAYASVELPGHVGAVNDIAWSPDGTSLATAGGDGTIRIWTAAGKPVKTYEKQIAKLGNQGGPVQVVNIAYTRDGKGIIFGGVAVRGHAGVLDLATGERRIDREDHSNTVMAVASSKTDDLAISAGGDENDLLVWRTTDGSLVHKLVGGGKSVWAVAAGDGNTLLGGNVNRGEPLPLTRPLQFAFNLERLEFVPQPRQIVSAQAALGDYAAKITSFTNLDITKGGQPYHKYQLKEGGGDRIYSATLIQGDHLVVGTGFRLDLVDLATKKIVRNFIGHSGIITSITPCPGNGMFLTGSSDQTIRLWKPDREEPVLSLFFAGREWIAWTPEGYYAASPGGERLMGWQVNNGHEKVGSFYSAIQFRQSLYQPDVIRSLTAAKGDLGLALAIASRDRRRPIPAVNLAQVLPPEVRITSPRGVSGAVDSPGETIEVTASAKSVGKNPVRGLRLLVDGRPYLGAKGLKLIADPKLGEVTAKWTVTLSPGKHTLIAQADAGVSKGLSAAVDVAQAGDAKKLPSLYVFSVGVNEYAGKMKLNFATSDAQSIDRVLREKTTGVFDKVEVKLLTDKAATRAEILKGLDWLESKMTDRDVGIFYFSGHGACTDDGTFFLVPVDVNPRDPAGTCVPGDTVKNKLAEMPGRLVAVFDACHSGAAADSLQAGGADDLVRELLTDDCGVAVLCSSMGDEYSLESSSTKAGFFTYSFVEGLSGKADFNGDGYIHIHEATAYASIRVQQLSKGQQNPTLGRSPNLKPFALTKK